MAPEPIQEDPGFWKEKPGANDLVHPPPANQPATITFPIFLFPVTHSTEATSDESQQQSATNPAPQQPGHSPTENNFLLFTLDPTTLEPIMVMLASSLFVQQSQPDPLSTTTADSSTPAVTAQRDSGSLNLPSTVSSEVPTDNQDSGRLNLPSTVSSEVPTDEQVTGSLNLPSTVSSEVATDEQVAGSLNLFSEIDSEVVVVERDTHLEVLKGEQDNSSSNLLSEVHLESTTGITTEYLATSDPLEQVSTSTLSPEFGASHISPHINTVNFEAAPDTKKIDKLPDNFTSNLVLSLSIEDPNKATDYNLQNGLSELIDTPVDRI